MNYLEAHNTVETALTRLKLKDQFGGHQEGIECSPALYKFHGDKWSQPAEDLQHERISPQTYADIRLELIQEYRAHLFKKRLETELVQAFRDQNSPPKDSEGHSPKERAS